MVFTKIISTILIGLLLSAGLWIACYIILMRVYPGYSLRIRHHFFSFVVAAFTFILYCSFTSISATISGIEQAFGSVKELILKKNDIVDNMVAILVSDSGHQAVIDETTKSISSVLSSNYVLNGYIESAGSSEIDTKSVVEILNAKGISITEKSLQIIDVLFDSYIGNFTRKLKRLWWLLLSSIVILQLIYWGVMIYRAENRSRVNRVYRSRSTSGEVRKYSRGSVDYRVRRRRP